MLKFHQIILRKFILIFSILFFIVGAIVYYWTKEFYLSQTRDALVNNIEILSFELKKDSNLDALAIKIKNNLKLRLTIISSEGDVIAESHKDKIKMDNHKYRDEIVQADSETIGYKIHYSESIDKDFLYIAKRYSFNNTFIYIRLSKELQNINEQIISLGMEIFAVLALFFIGIFIITYKVSKEIEQETQKIVNFLTSLTKKEKNTYISSEFSLEFSHITKLLTKVSQILVKKEKQKSKYTAKLQKSNKQKDDIISAISHEFKNPIAVINGYSQTLLDDKEINPNIRNKFLTKIYKNGTKLSDLIDTLRLSIKLDSGKQSLNFVSFNLYDLVLDSIENMEINYPKRELKIEGDKDIMIKADNSLFSVVLSNLIENACKYSEDSVLIRFDEKGIDVIDSGIGINKENLENITDKFYRVHENSWNNSLGLGLFIVNNILKLHNFKLNIQSVENHGSTFSVQF
ncbi:MAG: HAMP domain-containing sensor histidine kinase [Campylobacterota bacterium]|nr:HAMP domain-containing sensor histidine kinase [Campylobacterota bacterium]